MPVILLERIPLPSLRTYTTISVLLLSCALFYADRMVTSLNSENDSLSVVGSATSSSVASSSSSSDDDDDDDEKMPVIGPKHDEHENLVNWTHDSYGWNMFYVLTEQVWCLWICINMVYCILLLLSKCIQFVVFGELRVSEQQNLKDNFWNFVFYKFIFIFGVMNVQTMDEVIGWVTWFTVLGFFNLHTQLCKDRFEYLSFSPATAHWIHVKLLSLLSVILFACMALLVVSGIVAMQAGLTIFAFMAAECLILGIKILYVMTRYAIHLWDLNMDGIWEKRSLYVYYSELLFQLSALIVEFAHHLHMLLYGNIFLSMASLVIFMQLRYLFHEFQRRVKRHKNYIRVVRNMEARFPMATASDLENCHDDCAICWERMENARKLPCGHFFHHSCLRSWLEQDTSCPTCRTMLNDRPAGDPNGNVPETEVLSENLPPPGATNQQTTNHFFHFDGSRYVSWLPSFSVEVTHTQLLPGTQPAMQTSLLDSMARQVYQVFPNIPLNIINDDLRITRSVDQTIDNILDGRVVVPTPSLSPGAPTTSMNPSPLGGDAGRELTTPPPPQPTVAANQPSVSAATAAAAAAFQMMTQAVAAGMTSTNIGDDITFNSQINPSLDNPETEPSTSSSSHPQRHPTTPLFQNPAESAANDSNPPNLSYPTRNSDDYPAVMSTGGRFSKSAAERETMLQQRKNMMMENARRRFLYIQRDADASHSRNPDLMDSETPHSSTDRNFTHRSELAYQAALRRRQREQQET